MNINILHVSDLHRDPYSPISNKTLLDSLKKDRDQYASSDNLGVGSVDLIVVSGDIVQGVRHGREDAEAIIQYQYEEALEFLEGLTDQFVDGHKESVVIVPGNHDVSDHHFRESLERVEIPSGGPRELIGPLFTGQSNLRWSWDELALYQIKDFDMYSKRFLPFVTFYNTFYGGSRRYSANEENQFDIFDFPDWGGSVTGFSSCSKNDLLNRQGAIHPDCLATASEELRKSKFHNRLRLAVWHHHVEGPPLKVDYMDPDIVQNLIYRDFSLGLHGHQHKPQYLDYRFLHGADRKITLISAGTLCGGAAYGFKRSYNLIQLDLENHSGKLHVREMQNDNLQMPIWGKHSSPPNLTGSLAFTFDPPPKPQGGHSQNISILLEAQLLHEQGEFGKAAEALLSLQGLDELGRPILLDCLLQLRDDAGVITVFDPPHGSSEAIAVMDSLWAEGRRERLGQLLESPPINASSDPSVTEVRTKYQMRLMR